MRRTQPVLFLAAFALCAGMFAAWLGCSGGLRPSQIHQANQRRSQTTATKRSVADTEPIQAALVQGDASSNAGYETRFREILQIQDPQEREEALNSVLLEWVSATPEAALRLAPQLASPEIRDHVLRYLAQSWATRAPDAASQWALAVSDPRERAKVAELVLSKVAESAPERATKLLEGQSDKVQPALIGNLAQQWAVSDFQSAYAWATALPMGETRQEVIRRIALVWSKTEPEKSAQLVVDQMSPGPAQTEAAVSVLHQWALKDLASAQSWANQFPEGALRERALGEIKGVAQMDSSSQQ